MSKDIVQKIFNKCIGKVYYFKLNCREQDMWNELLCSPYDSENFCGMLSYFVVRLEIVLDDEEGMYVAY